MQRNYDYNNVYRNLVQSHRSGSIFQFHGIADRVILLLHNLQIQLLLILSIDRLVAQ